MPEEEQPPINAAGRPIRQKRPTWKILELLPDPPSPVPVTVPDIEDQPDEDATPPPVLETFIWAPIQTVLNVFGLFRRYPSIPSHNPDEKTSLVDMYDNGVPISHAASVSLPVHWQPLVEPGPNERPPHYPFQNSTIAGLMRWMWTGSAMKSLGEMGKLIDFLKSDSFCKDDLDGFDIRTETARLDDIIAADGEGSSIAKDGWVEQTVKIEVPDGKAYPLQQDIPTFEVPGLHARRLTEVIKSAIHDSSADSFHYTPFKEFWQPSPESNPERIYDELYSSDAFIEQHNRIQEQPPEPGCELERVVAGLMFWSDSTHLASFGNASLWPLYLYFGNQSKWLRGKPTSGACHHVAYIPKVYVISCLPIKNILTVFF